MHVWKDILTRTLKYDVRLGSEETDTFFKDTGEHDEVDQSFDLPEWYFLSDNFLRSGKRMTFNTLDT